MASSVVNVLLKRKIFLKVLSRTGNIELIGIFINPVLARTDINVEVRYTCIKECDKI